MIMSNYRPKERHLNYAAYNGNVNAFRGILKECPEYMNDEDILIVALVTASISNRLNIIDEMINNGTIYKCFKIENIRQCCSHTHIECMVKDKLIKEIGNLPLPDDIIANIVKKYL